jgi:hypothetical protein
MPRRVESERAPKVASRAALECLTIRFTIRRNKNNVKRELGGNQKRATPQGNLDLAFGGVNKVAIVQISR